MPTGFLWREAIAAVGGRTAWEPTFVCLPTQMGQQQLVELSQPVFPSECLRESGPREAMKDRPGLWKHPAWRLFTTLTANPVGSRGDGRQGSTDSSLLEEAGKASQMCHLR